MKQHEQEREPGLIDGPTQENIDLLRGKLQTAGGDGVRKMRRDIQSKVLMSEDNQTAG
jgi:hypothetical protein